MTFSVEITASADRDIQAAYEWWRDNRSPEQALRWYEAIYPAMDSLKKMPRRCPMVREEHGFAGEVRELSFGLSHPPSHRIIFEVRDDLVVILHVRGASRQDMS